MNYQQQKSLLILNSYMQKGKGANVGEVRTWSDGKQHKKTNDGWIEIPNEGHVKEWVISDPKEKTIKPTSQRKKALQGLNKAKAKRFLMNEFKDKEFDDKTIDRIVDVMIKFKRSKSNFY